MSNDTNQTFKTEKEIKATLKANIVAELFLCVITFGLIALMIYVTLPNLGGVIGFIVNFALILITIFLLITMVASLLVSKTVNIPPELKSLKTLSLVVQIVIIVLFLAIAVLAVCDQYCLFDSDDSGYEIEEDVGSDNYSGFTNKYGSPDTYCAHKGCTAKIASSGDTNCCELHSKRCGECNCYIDEDALFCMSCLEKALKK